ncbi:TPA: hypothetical protein ROY17_004781 [Bacillus thuringiensis]|nr:hypothetical protein [Bacillus thuringiensis]
MKKQVKILLTAGMIMSPAFLTSIVPLPGVGIHAYANTAETFDKVEKDIIDKSKDVITKETEAWKKELKSDVKTTIESICKETDLKTITKINTELRQGEETKSKDTIEKLDAALRAAPVTKEATKVYIDVSLKSDFGISKDNVKTEETVIAENGYIKGSLARNTSASTSEVIELTIPKGEHMANMTASGSSTLSYNELLERGRSFVITAKKEIKDMGKTRTKFEAKLLPKDFVKETNTKAKTNIDGINVLQGKEAVESSGLVKSHVDGFKKVAEKNDTYLLFRPVNPLSTSLIEEGAATKGMNVHGKSSDWGPMAGNIPYDADLSKKHGDEINVKKGNEDNRHSVLENDGKDGKDKITTKALTLSDQRIKVLEAANVISMGETQQEGGKSYIVINVQKNSNVYEFRMDQDSRKVEYKTKTNQQTILGEEIKEWREIEVMAKEVDGKALALTADYDAFAYAPNLKNIRLTENPESQEKINNLSPVEKFKLAETAIVNALIRENKNDGKGTLTEWQRNIIDELNEAAKNAGYTGGTVVNHGTEQDNTEFPEQDKEIFIITPDGKEILTKSWEDTQAFIQKNIRDQGYLYYINRAYNTTAAGNHAQIPWNEPGNEVSAKSIPNSSRFQNEINTIVDRLEYLSEPEKTALKTTIIWQEKSSALLELYYQPENQFLEQDTKNEVMLFRGIQLLQHVERLSQVNANFPELVQYFTVLEENIQTKLNELLAEQNITMTVDQLINNIDFSMQLDNPKDNEQFINFLIEIL